MALKGFRNIGDGSDTNIQYFMNETATRGRIVIHATSGSGLGEALDDANTLVAVPSATGALGTPAGLLTNDVVNLDLTRTHINQHKDEVQLGNKVTVLQRGEVLTDVIYTGDTPSQGDAAYYRDSGELTTTQIGSTLQVGRFLSGKDSDGFAKVLINIR